VERRRGSMASNGRRRLIIARLPAIAAVLAVALPALAPRHGGSSWIRRLPEPMGPLRSTQASGVEAREGDYPALINRD
jgi:hypothetical protein